MKRSDAKPLASAIKEYLRVMKLERKLKEVDITRNWEEIAGKTIARATKKVYIRNNKLYIHTSSSILRNELLMVREGLRERLNERLQENMIHEIIVM